MKKLNTLSSKLPSSLILASLDLTKSPIGELESALLTEITTSAGIEKRASLGFAL